MNISELEDFHQRIRSSDRFDDHLAFGEKLLSSSDPEVVRFHYELLRDRSNKDLYQWLRAKFVDRKEVAERFLVDRIKDEHDPKMLADILQLLGHLRSKAARPLALQYAQSTDEHQRDVATFVLGWIGTVGDMKKVLAQLLREDPAPLVRGDAATAMRQVWYRRSEAKAPAIELLADALKQEKDERVLASIIVTLQTLMKKRFGLREPDDEPEIEGDVEEAREKALRALARNASN